MSNTPSDAEIDAFLDSPADVAWVIAGTREKYRLLVRAVLAKWGTPQPVVREPLSHKELQAISLDYSDSEDECTGFRDGWRFAEKHYGITQKGGSNAE